MSDSRVIKRHVNRVLLAVFLVTVVFVYIFPVYFTVVSSVKSTTEIFNEPLALTSNPRFMNYQIAWTSAKIGRAFLNSTILSAGTIAVITLIGSMASYMLAKFTFRLRGPVYLLFTMGLMIPIQAIIIPLAIQITSMGLRGNFLVIILIFVGQFLPMSIFILTGFIRTIPNSLEESAYVDGASHFLIFWRIIVPLAKGGLSTVIIFVYLFSWNDLLVPLVFTSGEAQRTLSIGLLSFLGGMQGQSGYGAFMAAVVITILPPIIIYVSASDMVEKGLTVGAMKG